jgi:hypothetical protein
MVSDNEFTFKMTITDHFLTCLSSNDEKYKQKQEIVFDLPFHIINGQSSVILLEKVYGI